MKLKISESLINHLLLSSGFTTDEVIAQICYLIESIQIEKQNSNKSPDHINVTRTLQGTSIQVRIRTNIGKSEFVVSENVCGWKTIENWRDKLDELLNEQIEKELLIK